MVQWLTLHAHSVGGTGSIPDHGTRSHMPQLKILHAAAKMEDPACINQVFPVVMYGCEIWTIKKAEHQRTDAFELWCWRKTLESPLDCKEIQPVHSKGDQSLVFIGTTDAEAETPIL